MRNVIATARTCYSSKGPIDPADCDPTRYADLVRGIYAAGHHTTFQHAHVQFRIGHLSRLCIWSFLHSHPFYNSEQVSQRYVEVGRDQFVTPPLRESNRARYETSLDARRRDYHHLIDLLIPAATEAYAEVYPARRRTLDRYAGAIRKRAMEAARAVLPLSVTAYLYHTVSVLTVLRYYRMCRSQDVSWEQEQLARAMVDALLEWDPHLRLVLEEPLNEEDFPEDSFRATDRDMEGNLDAFTREFDASLEGRTSALVDWSPRAELTLATAVRDVLGLPSSALSDDEAIALALDPARNGLFGESLVLTTQGKLSRALHTVQYTFRRKLSHSADSQDQRHRMTPAARPLLAAQVGGEPDVVMPQLIAAVPEAAAYFRNSVATAWKDREALLDGGEPQAHALYLLPNAVSVRYSQSSDLLHLHHKHAMRLCYNAQEEIWQSALDEALRIREVHPRIGRWLLPPCSLRHRAGRRPYCPEGDRYCGVPVWKLDPTDYRRIL